MAIAIRCTCGHLTRGIELGRRQPEHIVCAGCGTRHELGGAAVELDAGPLSDAAVDAGGAVLAWDASKRRQR